MITAAGANVISAVMPITAPICDARAMSSPACVSAVGSHSRNKYQVIQLKKYTTQIASVALR